MDRKHGTYTPSFTIRCCVSKCEPNSVYASLQCDEAIVYSCVDIEPSQRVSTWQKASVSYIQGSYTPPHVFNGSLSHEIPTQVVLCDQLKV